MVRLRGAVWGSTGMVSAFLSLGWWQSSLWLGFQGHWRAANEGFTPLPPPPTSFHPHALVPPLPILPDINSPPFLCLKTVDILNLMLLLLGPRACILGCWTEFLASTHDVPGEPLYRVITHSVSIVRCLLVGKMTPS